MSPRTPRQLAELRRYRARLCSARVGSGRCRLPWSIAKRLDVSTDDESLLCVRHARAKHVELWTPEQERREVRALRAMQLSHDRLVSGRR